MAGAIHVEKLFERINTVEGFLEDLEMITLFFLPSMVESVEGNIVEIGAWMGKSTICLTLGNQLVSSQSKQVITIDTFDCRGNYGSLQRESTLKEFKANIAKFELEKSVQYIVGDSENVQDQIHCPISLLFIDGDHTYEGVRSDIQNYCSKVSEQGLIVFHDYAYPGEPDVAIAVDEFLNHNPMYQKVLMCKTMLVVRKLGNSSLQHEVQSLSAS